MTKTAQNVDILRQQLQHYADEQAFLLEVTQRIAHGGALGDLLPDIAQTLQRGLQADSVRILLGARAAHATYAAGESSAAFAPHDEIVLRYAAANGKFESAKLSADGTPAALKPLAGALHSVLIMPMMAHGAYYGAIWAAYKAEHSLEETDRNFVSILAGQTAVAVANAHAFEEARRGREQLEAILISTADPVLVIDTDETILLLNPAAESVFNVSAESAIGKRIDEVIDAEPLLPLLKGSTEPAEIIEWQNASGRAFAPRISDIGDNQDEHIGRVLILRDITRYKNLRDNQTEFVSTVSHDLRSPLTYMNGYVDMLGMVGGLNDKQKGFTEKIATGINQMTDLVDKILDASRLDPDGNYQLNREQCDVSKVIHEVISLHSAAAEKKGLALKAEISEPLPILSLDEVMLKRALNNLTDNAIKYTQTGSITLKATVKDNALQLSVRDTGAGISEENQKLVFERFKRVRRREHQGVKGSGLGLYIVKRVAERHDGKAWVEGKENEGSTFFIEIPIEGPNLVGGGKA